MSTSTAGGDVIGAGKVSLGSQRVRARPSLSGFGITSRFRVRLSAVRAPVCSGASTICSVALQRSFRLLSSYLPRGRFRQGLASGAGGSCSTQLGELKPRSAGDYLGPARSTSRQPTRQRRRRSRQLNPRQELTSLQPYHDLAILATKGAQALYRTPAGVRT